jgi:methyl-accepting chemotaxis protein
MKLSIRAAIISFSVLVLLSTISAIGIGSYALSTLRIGGTLYPALKDNYDLLADILPPPIYVIEPYLVVKEAKEDFSNRDRHTQRLKALHTAYTDRKKFWAGRDLSADANAAIAQAVRLGDKFWEDIETKFIPAVQSGDEAAIARAGQIIQADYAAQRGAIDALVTLSTKATEAYQEKVDGENHFYSALVLAASVIAGLLLLGSIVWLLSRVVAPLLRLSNATAQVAGGKFEVEIPATDRKDELGDLARKIAHFKDVAMTQKAQAVQQASVVELLAGGLRMMSDGDLQSRLHSEFPQEYEQLRTDFNAAAKKLQETLQGVTGSAETIRTGANEISQASDDLSRRTEQQAASLEETAAALEEITATVRKTAQNAKDASQIVSNAKQAAESSGLVVDTAIRAMTQIEQSSKQITDIIGVIDEIAFQTNLLALNAGVEAARAGDAGRGFAVVASEVRALAQRSSEAAKEIKGLIKQSGQHVDEGVKFVGETGEALKRIAVQVVNIDALVSEIAQAAQQQYTGIEEVNVAVGQMDQVTQQNAAMVEQSTAASRNLANETSELAHMIGFFKIGGVAEGKSVHAATTRAELRVPLSAPRPKLRSRGNLAVAQSDPRGDDWSEF